MIEYPIDPTSDPSNPRPKEGARAFQAFCAYRDFGPNRSIDAVAKQLHKGSQILARWSRLFGWVDRARAFDDAMDRARVQARLVEAARAGARAAALWEQRKSDSLELAYRSAEALRITGESMLRASVVKEVVEDGTVSFEPQGRWSHRDAALILRTSIEIKSACFLAIERSLESLSEMDLRAIAGIEDFELESSVDRPQTK